MDLPGNQAAGHEDGNQHVQMVSEPKIASSSISLPAVPKLKGRENYVTWTFAMRMVMIREGTWRAVDHPEDYQVDPDLSDKALATICLSIEPYNYSIVQRSKTAMEAWNSLKTAFQDCGRSRKISLLRKLTRLELEDCSSVEEYVDEIMSTSHKLEEIGFVLDDEWLSLILLMGLPKQYEPMIMGLDASGIKLTADMLKSKILQDVSMDTDCKSSGAVGALATRPKKVQKKKDKSSVKCFRCDKFGHYASECQAKPKSKPEKGFHGKQTALLACKKPKLEGEDWILYSGAGRHMCSTERALIYKREVTESIFVANATEVPVPAVGRFKLDADVEGTCSTLDIADVLYVPDLAVNLLSGSRICNKGFRVNFSKDSCEVSSESTGETIATGTEEDGLYKLRQYDRPKACVAKPGENLELWHRRYGHLNLDSVKRLPSMVTGIDVRGKDIPACGRCAEGKHHKLPFKATGNRSCELLDLVHSDLCGPMEKPSIGGSKYFVTFIDDASRVFSHVQRRSF